MFILVAIKEHSSDSNLSIVIFFFNLKNLSQNISDVLYAEYKNRVIKEMYEYKKNLKNFPFNKYCSEYLIDGFLTLLKTNNCY